MCVACDRGHPEVMCDTCDDVGWICAGTDKPADFVMGSCCHPGESEEFGGLGVGCPSANGCPDCGVALREERQ